MKPPISIPVTASLVTLLLTSLVFCLATCGNPQKDREAEETRVALAAAKAEIEILRQAGGDAEKAAALRKEAADNQARQKDERTLKKIRAMEPKSGPNRIYYFAFHSHDPDFGHALALFSEERVSTGESIVSITGDSALKSGSNDQCAYSEHAGYWVVTQVSPR